MFMPDKRLQQIFDELEIEAVRRCRETPEGKEASSEYCRLWDALLAVIPKELRDILFAFESAVGWKGAVEGEYIREAVYLYGVRKGIEIAGGIEILDTGKQSWRITSAAPNRTKSA